MTASAIAWIALAAFLLVAAVRVSLSEAVWRTYRVERWPRRMVRGLDALAVVLGAVLAAGLFVVVLPTLLAG